jgi:hypothetical protein
VESSAVFMLLTFVVFTGYGMFAAAVRRHVVSRPRVMTWMRRTFAKSIRRARRQTRAHLSLGGVQPSLGASFDRRHPETRTP